MKSINQSNTLNIPMNDRILEAGNSVLTNSLQKHNKVFVQRIDIRLPLEFQQEGIIPFNKRFIEKEKNAGYDPRYIIVRELSIDLIKQKAYVYTSDVHEEPHEQEIPEEYKEKVQELRGKLFEALANFDEEILMMVLEGQEPDVETTKNAIRKAVLTGEFHPVFCGSAYKNKNIQLLLDGVVDYLPSPLDIPPAKGVDEDGNEVTCPADDNGNLGVLAFKIATDPFIGRLAYVRVYSGVLKAGSYVINSTKGVKERIVNSTILNPPWPSSRPPAALPRCLRQMRCAATRFRLCRSPRRCGVR